MDFLISPFELEFVRRGLLEVLLLSVGAGLLGTWIVLRGLAFYTHAVGTAAFPGLVLADGLGFAAPLGALGGALAFAVVLGFARRRRETGHDSLIALALAGALALGVILASDVFRSDAGVESLLFGSLLLIEPRDLALAAAASVLTGVATASLGRAWLAMGFDPTSARALGLRSAFPEQLLLVLVAFTVIASISALGALLVAALIITPAATVRIWTTHLPAWRTGAIVLTAVEGTVGLWLSVKTNAPPGATIAVLAGGAFALSAVAKAVVRPLPRKALAVGALVLGALALGSCGGADAGGASDGRVRVVATTTQIGDWARQVGGDAVEVHQILKPNGDPHDYELRPADVEAAAGADLLFRSGDDLDPWAREMVEKSGGDPDIVDLSKVVPERRPGEENGSEASRFDPHWWHDPTNVLSAVTAIRDALAQADPGERQQFSDNASRYRARVATLDRLIERCIDRVPRSERKLVTDHDALGYFAKRYALEVVGALIPSQTTEAQPSAGELAELADLIRREHVRAVFPEKEVSPKLAEAIARETGASSNYELYSDTLGPEGSDGDTYLEMEAANAETIVRGLTGGRARCALDVP